MSFNRCSHVSRGAKEPRLPSRETDSPPGCHAFLERRSRLAQCACALHPPCPGWPRRRGESSVERPSGQQRVPSGLTPYQRSASRRTPAPGRSEAQGAALRGPEETAVRLWRRGPEPSRAPRAGETLGREAECRAEERGSQGRQGPRREGGALGRRSSRREACRPEDRRGPPQARGGVAVRTRGRVAPTAPAASREKWTRGMGGASGKKQGARCTRALEVRKGARREGGPWSRREALSLGGGGRTEVSGCQPATLPRWAGAPGSSAVTDPTGSAGGAGVRDSSVLRWPPHRV